LSYFLSTPDLAHLQKHALRALTLAKEPNADTQNKKSAQNLSSPDKIKTLKHQKNHPEWDGLSADKAGIFDGGVRRVTFYDRKSCC
jgi:hypothetical protein